MRKNEAFCAESLMPAPPPPPPPLAPTANPLKGLPALPKRHYSWYRHLANKTYSKLGAADNHETLVDYACVRKRRFGRRFLMNTDHFTKTGSGQAQGKLKKRAAFWFRRRITHSMPVVHCGNLELGCPDSHAEVNASVAICIEAGGDCVLSLDLSPYGPASRNII